jgi:hypothetical protein
MLELRFDESWLNATSPLQLRFVGELIPEPPIRFGGIGIELGLGIGKGLRLDNQLVLHSLSRYIALDTAHIWGGKSAEHQDYGLVWHTKALEQQRTISPWLRPQLHKQQFSVNWATPNQHQMHTQLDWLTPLQRMTVNVAKWSQSQPKEQLASVFWRQVPGTQICQGIAYSYKGQRGFEYSLPWGPHQPQWICSTRYVPQTGKITMRFGEPWTNSQSPLALRFTIEPKVCHFDDGGGLIDAHPSLPTIDFKIPIEPQIRRSYLMEPQVSCIRVRDGLAVVLTSVSISTSRGQWTSTCSLSFSSRLDAMHANNELLKVSINGYEFFLLCESPSSSKIFNAETYSATGRGRLAELATPYKKSVNFVNHDTRSFMGLMTDIIANSGWAVTGVITDYPVPANCFSYANKTPAEAINFMASAIGAMLDINDETRTINVIPQWPVVPWETSSAIPDVILHDSVILEFTEHLDIRPEGNAVFVRGEQQGVAVKVKRFGTAGDNFAADIVDKLITDNQAARMRGTTELANAGNKIQNSIRTKVLNDLPPIRPGMLVGIRKGAEVFKSVCDASTITASVNSTNGQVTVNQTISLLRNENTL